MSHVHRRRASDGIFFITVNLRRVLAPLTGSEYALVANAFIESRRRLHLMLLGYVLMPDHWHALVWAGYPLSVSRAVQDVKWISARSLNRKRRATGAVWQHQFWDRFVRHGKEFGDRLTYMHLNPVRRQLVGRPEDWRWPSCNNFALDKATVAACPVQIDYVQLPAGYRA